MVSPEEPPFSPDLPPWLRRLALALFSLFLLIPALRLLQPLPIYGDDHSSHLAAVHHLLALLRAGQTDLFCPTFNLGFPMYLYYQPLPHVSAALVYLASFGLLGEQLAFNLTVVALWCCYPLTTYLGARRLGLGDTASLLAGLCAPLVSSSLPFGFTLHSLMGLGLYTQLYAMVLFPLCLGWTWRALQGDEERGWIGAAGLHVLIWLSHAFYGVAAATAAGLMVVVCPGRWRRAVPRLLLIGLGTVASLLFWLIPLALTHKHAGGWPWDGVDRWEGYGIRHVLVELLRGRLFDERQLPLISLAVAGGLALAVLQVRRSDLLRGLLGLFGLFLIFMIGRRSLGPLVDLLQPANRGLQLFRYIGPLHGAGVLLAGVGLAGLAAGLTRLGTPRRLALAATVAVLIAPMTGLALRGRALFHTIRAYQITDRDLAAAGKAIGEAIRAGEPPGRIYAHARADTGAHLVAAAMSLHTDQPMGQSYGVSMHDALGFYYLEHLDPLDSNAMALYNFRFALAGPRSPLARHQEKGGNPPLLRRPALLLFSLPGDHRYLQPVNLSLALVGSPREVRPAALRWLGSSWPMEHHYGLVIPDLERRPAWLSPALRGNGDKVEVLDGDGVTWRPFDGPLSTPPRRAAPGRLLEEKAELNRYQGEVRMTRPGAVALKAGFHPFWEARVNGEPTPTLHLTPCFLGVQVPAGRHRVSFQFRNPLYQKILFAGSLIAWLLVGGARIRRRRRHPAAGSRP